MDKLKLNFDHKTKSLYVRFFSRLRHGGTVHSRIADLLEEVHQSAIVIQRTLNAYGGTGKEFEEKTNTLLRYFISDFLKGRGKSAFKQTFLQLPREVTEPIDPVSWIAAWSFITLVIAFVMYWILQWGTNQGDTIVEAWGINYMVSFFWTVCVQECIKLFVMKVLLV
jgi:hypothetical protein